MKYIYREEHKVYVDYEIDLSDEFLIEMGINPHSEEDICEYLLKHHKDLGIEPTEWWISAQLNNQVKKIGLILSDDNSENSINWINNA